MLLWNEVDVEPAGWKLGWKKHFRVTEALDANSDNVVLELVGHRKEPPLPSSGSVFGADSDDLTVWKLVVLPHVRGVLLAKGPDSLPGGVPVGTLPR